VRILLVEDDETALEVFQEALTEYDYEVVTARNGEEAIAKARQQSFDLVVTDVRMPGTDGLQALEEVKAMNPETKSIVVTGYVSEAETLKAMQIGVGEYLKKPFRLSELLRAVKRQLERTRQDELERQRERALRATLMWALKMFLNESRLPKGSWVQESGKWAITLGRQLGLPDDEVESLSLATIILALNKASADILPAFVTGSLPDSVRALLEFGLEENVNPEARQVIEAAQRLAQSSLAPDQARAQDGDDYASRRGLLQVALSLEAAGDNENAGTAFHEVAQSGVNREAVQAALGAARVAWKSGKSEATRELASQASTLARSVGPLAQAEVTVEAGILLAISKVDEARTWLAEGKKICEGLGLVSRVALASLAEALFFDSSGLNTAMREVTVALSPRELRDQVYWLLPALLDSAAARSSGEVAPLMTALVASEQTLAARILRDPRWQAAVTELCQHSSDPEFLKAVGYQEQGSEPAAPEAAAATSGHNLRIFGLGKMDFFVDGRPLPEAAWKRNQKAKLLLFRLCLDPQRSFTDEVLIEELWPGQDHASKANLNALRATLRSALRGGESDAFEFVVREGKGTRIHPECKVILDARELLDAVQRARQSKGEPFERLHLTKLVELYTGPFLESCYLEWAASTRTNLEHAVLESLHRLCQLAEEAGNHDQVLECATRILQLDRCNQEAYRLGMQAYIQSGRPEQAVRLFERCSRVLKSELEMEPSIELLSLYHRAKLSL